MKWYKIQIRSQKNSQSCVPLNGLSMISAFCITIGKILLRLIAQASAKSNAAYLIQVSKMYEIWYENT